MKYSIALTSDLHSTAIGHLLQEEGQEDLCFALWHPSRGSKRMTGLLKELILPLPGERQLHGNVSFNPEYFDRALQLARATNSGLALLHSHIGPGWQDMSRDDIKAELDRAGAVFGITRHPFIGMTLGTDGSWSGRFWHKIGPKKYERTWCESVRVIGNGINMTYHDGLMPPPGFRQQLLRTISAWGETKQASLARLHVGIVGLGSVGSIVAESIARMGVTNIHLIDFDTVELHNLDRLLNATAEDAASGNSKVFTSAKQLVKSATAKDFHVEQCEYSVVEDDGYRAALNCDIIFCCVDRPWPRAVLNQMAYAHLIPVVDGGISIMSHPHSGLRRADWRAHVALPGRPCLECLGQYDSSLVSVERDGYFDNPQYIQGLPDDHALKRPENVFGFSISAASFEILQFLSMVIQPLGRSSQGAQAYHFVTGMLDTNWHDNCGPNCLFTDMTSLGDDCGYVLTGRHILAEQKREERRINNKRNSKRPFVSYALSIFKRIPTLLRINNGSSKPA